MVAERGTLKVFMMICMHVPLLSMMERQELTEIIAISFPFWGNTSKRIEEETGISRENTLICATHTHGGTSPDPYYMNGLADKLINATKDALNNLKPACIGAGKGICKMNINRRARAAIGGLTLSKNQYKPVDWEVRCCTDRWCIWETACYSHKLGVSLCYDGIEQLYDYR